LADLFKKLIINKVTTRLFLRPLLKLHSACYKWISRFAIVANAGIHPKHSIIDYEKWFCDNVQAGWCVLDIGCNTGILAKRLSHHAGFVYGIDIDSELIKQAQRQNNSDNIKYICADANNFDWRVEKPIDCVVLSNVLEHIAERPALIRNIITRINWGANRKLLIRVPTIERDWIAVYKKNLGLSYKLDKTHYIEYTLQEFVKELERNGIRIEKMEMKFGEIYSFCSVL
jgi:2-polyprenyl-3-methyl-5-hydroxy-6-metoxy-1,4-benzoquinol methylase